MKKVAVLCLCCLLIVVCLFFSNSVLATEDWNSEIDNAFTKLPGDLDGDLQIDNRDVEYLLWHTLFPEDYPLTCDADYDEDGAVDNKDVEYLLWHTLFPDDYPLPEPAPTVPTPTEPATKPYIIGLEVVSSQMPNAYYCSNGQDLLSRMYGGKNKAFQTGDSVTIRVNMSDGGSDFTVVDENYDGCTVVSQNGNLITITFDGSKSNAYITVKAYNESGRKVSKTIGFAVVRYRGKITEDWTTIYDELKNYAVRIGLTWVNNGSDMTGYTHDDESKSITGYTVKLADDFVPIPGNPRWIEKALWVLDTYKSMGFTRVNFNVVLANGFQSLAE